MLTLRPEQITIVNDQAWIGLPDTKNGMPHMILVHPNAIDALRYVPFNWGDRYYYQQLIIWFVFFCNKALSGAVNCSFAPNNHIIVLRDRK